MNTKVPFITLLFFISFLIGSNLDAKSQNKNNHRAVQKSVSNGTKTITCNLPCKTVYIHPEKKGKALLVVWLHGGVHDRKLHNLRTFNHLDCCAADDSIVNYLNTTNKKAICIMPVCYKADSEKLITWKECADDVKAIIDDYVSNGDVDEHRIYLTGSSDGGTGTWELSEIYGKKVFAAAIALSCGAARMVDLPIFWHSTKAEDDYSAIANKLKEEGCNLKYDYHPSYEHGKDEQVCTKSFLDYFFSFRRP